MSEQVQDSLGNTLRERHKVERWQRYDTLIAMLEASCVEAERTVLDGLDGNKAAYTHIHHLFLWPPRPNAQALQPTGIQGSLGYRVHMLSSSDHITGCITVDLIEHDQGGSLTAAAMGQVGQAVANAVARATMPLDTKM